MAECHPYLCPRKRCLNRSGLNRVAAAGRRLEEDWERLVTFYAFPKEHWKHLRTTNVVESPFAAVRRRTAAAKRFKKVENATTVIWKTLLAAEQGFRRLDASELLREVAEGVAYVDGARESGATRRSPPDLVYTLLDETSHRCRYRAGLGATAPSEPRWS